MPVQLFVGNLSYQTTEAELREYFSAVGPLVSLHLPTDRESGRPRGFAFVEFHEPTQAEEAIRRFNNQPFQGRPLTVNPARAREQRSGVRMPASVPSSLPSTDRTPAPGMADTGPERRGGVRHNFGPDAARRGQRKPETRRPKAPRGPKGPIRVQRGRQFLGGDEEDTDSDGLSVGNLTTSQE